MDDLIPGPGPFRGLRDEVFRFSGMLDNPTIVSVHLSMSTLFCKQEEIDALYAAELLTTVITSWHKPPRPCCKSLHVSPGDVRCLCSVHEFVCKELLAIWHLIVEAGPRGLVV